jgi:hypothetical protein
MVARRAEIKSGRNPKANIRWLGPLPIWSQPGPAGLRLHESVRAAQPAVLRFDHDDFMQEFISTLTSEPQRLGEWLAQPETWRRPMATPKTAQPESQVVSKMAFLYDKTHRMTKAKKSLLPTAINLQPLKTLFRKKNEPAITMLDDEQLPLKLYQAGQKRHYLVTASLISEEPGMPDCEPELRRQEKASFVIRRLLPPETLNTHSEEESKSPPMEQWDEYAFVRAPYGNNWRRIGSHSSSASRTLIVGEEQLPLFPVSFKGSCGNNRRLLSGVIPVSRREQWVGASLGADAESSVANSVDRSMASFLFQADVVAPWKMLLEQAEFKKEAADTGFSNFSPNATAKANDRKRLMRTSRDEIQTGSWYVLLDFARFLQEHLPDIWQVLTGLKPAASLDDGEQKLLAVLENTLLSWQLAFRLLSGKSETETLSQAENGLKAVLQYNALDYVSAAGGLSLDPIQLAGAASVPSSSARYRYSQLKWSLADGLVAALDAEEGLEEVDTTFIRFNDQGAPQAIDSNWPGFLFPLADPDLPAPIPVVAASELTGLSGLERTQAAVDVLAEMVEALLPAGQAAEELIDRVPVGDPRDVWFVVRCVYERPNCGPLFTTLVSAPTQRFQMAPFFDPDAPVRSVRIPMPLDISPAGLRKYQKNTGFVISDMLCGKIKGIRKMSFADLVLSVLPWPFHKNLREPGSGTCKKGSNSFGMICSLSIPIVTLCALILMMIIVGLFDLFFRWIPYLFVCLPIPGLKGKKK